MATKPTAAYTAARAPVLATKPAAVAAIKVVAAETAIEAAVVEAVPALTPIPEAAPAVAPVAPAPVAVAPVVVAPVVVAPGATTPVPVKQHMEKVVKTAEEFVAFGQGNVEAFVKCGQIWTAGVQDLSKQVAATAQAQFDETMSTFKAMSSMKSLKDLFDLQSTYTKAALKKTMSESGKLTDASLKLTEQALAPIAARVSTAVETFGKAA